WYTGTVGWVDSEGNGRFVVAIRCGLLTTNRAYIFTGAGIVADSDAGAEYAETELKQLPMLRALGLSL
ncbi:MAG: chorismate-binding protein, partial [Polyangiaceae bacterium]